MRACTVILVIVLLSIFHFNLLLADVKCYSYIPLLSCPVYIAHPSIIFLVINNQVGSAPCCEIIDYHSSMIAAAQHMLSSARKLLVCI